MIQLHVFTSVEALVEWSDRGENVAAIGDRHGIGLDETLAIIIHARAGVVAEARGSGDGDGALQGGSPRDVERLGTAQAVGPARLEGTKEVRQVVGIVKLAMAVNDYDDVTPGDAQGGVPART
jgi:hypothetical protein